jgi:hypothetical protein
VYIAIQAFNEKAWERYITKLWIEHMDSVDPIISKIWNYLSSKIFKTPKTPESATKKIIKFEEEDMDKIVQQYHASL